MTGRQEKLEPGSGATVREPPNFGRRQQPATITISRGGRVRHFTVNPLFASVAFSLVAMFAVGYLLATAYLVFRDDLIGAAQARNARLLHEYEDRIAALRANLDRVMSRQLLDQQAIETKIAELMQRQEMLRGRSGKIGRLVEEAHKRGLLKGDGHDENRQTRLPTPSAGAPSAVALAPAEPVSLAAAGGITLRGTHDAASAAPNFAMTQTVPDIGNMASTRSVFSTVAGRIEAIDGSQRAMIDEIRQAASERTNKIAGVIRGLKIAIPEDVQDRVGGPYIPLEPEASFGSQVEALDLSLTTLDRLTARVKTLPVGNPVPGRAVSSNFGKRLDPFVGRAAMHSGIDFSAATGTPIKASAAGEVIDAGLNGGYGKMVEIDHGGGISTRYAHMSKILVRSGEKVERGTVIGRVGTTGRSTGPHLHYEIRKGGSAINPLRFLRAGRELAGLL